MAFDMDNAQERLEAIEKVGVLVQAGTEELMRAGVTNTKIFKALSECAEEVAKYRRATKFAISKRRERGKNPERNRRREECRQFIS